ncbi:hypothetical protein VTK73DRAFT_2147 [Phialemonium thermophilum]|uniref:Uncharacterized protein n=1 Tax=Phialemonium thermophilum TaxID=223376 RepID=A0ABR3VSI5_9PEZI
MLPDLWGPPASSPLPGCQTAQPQDFASGPVPTVGEMPALSMDAGFWPSFQQDHDATDTAPPPSLDRQPPAPHPLADAMGLVPDGNAASLDPQQVFALLPPSPLLGTLWDALLKTWQTTSGVSRLMQEVRRHSAASAVQTGIRGLQQRLVLGRKGSPLHEACLGLLAVAMAGALAGEQTGDVPSERCESLQRDLELYIASEGRQGLGIPFVTVSKRFLGGKNPPPPSLAPVHLPSGP